MRSVGSHGNDLDRLLEALRADPSPDELAGEGQAVISIAAWVRSHQVGPLPGLTPPRPAAGHAIRPLSAKVATSVISAAFAATSSLAVAGALPDPARRFASQLFARIGVHGSPSTTEAHSGGPSRQDNGAPAGGGGHEAPRPHPREPHKPRVDHQRQPASEAEKEEVHSPVAEPTGDPAPTIDDGQRAGTDGDQAESAGHGGHQKEPHKGKGQGHAKSAGHGGHEKEPHKGKGQGHAKSAGHGGHQKGHHRGQRHHQGQGHGSEAGDGTETGQDQGTETGQDQGTETGQDQGTETGQDQGAETGQDQGAGGQGTGGQGSGPGGGDQGNEGGENASHGDGSHGDGEHEHGEPEQGESDD